jgi:methylmalonyl-CoA mutase
VGVNTFQDPEANYEESMSCLELARATDDQKDEQLRRLAAFKEAHAATAGEALMRLQKTALAGGNMFQELMETVHHCSLGTITQALFNVGGKYRRNM